MAKLIGTNPNQVPSNADLGSMAYQDKESVTVDNITVADTVTADILLDQGRVDHVSNTMPQPYYRFDGSNDYINMGDVGFIDNLTQFSVSIWFKAESDSNNHHTVIFSKDNQIECWIKWNGNQNYALSVNNNHFEFTNSATPLGEWVHVVYTWDADGDVRKLYQNGTLIQTGSGNQDGVDIQAGDTALSVGARAGGGYYSHSEISNVRFYNNILTATEVKQLYSGASVPFKYKGADQVEMVSNGTFGSDSQWNKGTGWTISGGKAVSTASTGDLTQSVSLVLGKAYQITYTISDYSSGSVRSNLGAYTAGEIRSANGTYTEILEPTYSSSNSLLYFYQVGGSFTGKIDNVSLVQIGAVAEYDGSSATTSKWYDKSGNGLDGTVTGATLQNKVKALEVDGRITTDGLSVKEVLETQVNDTATIDLTAGTIFHYTSATTVTMPTAEAGRSITVVSDSGQLSWAGATIKWSGGTVPSGTGIIVYSFIAIDNTGWLGMEAGSAFA